MADQTDIEVVRLFLNDVVKTYRKVAENGRIRSSERIALGVALTEFQSEHPERIISQYAGLGDEQVRDAGLYGQQLRQKYEVARLASSDFEGPADRRVRFSTTGIRRWIKRARLLVNSLLKGVPGAEALGELLDLLDAALDRA
jgi:hypothetical protein